MTIDKAESNEVALEVLGPVQARHGDELVSLGGPKQKTVLAMLIAAAGDTVSADVIAQAVYGEDAPERARRRVQTYVSTLRSILGDVIVRRGAGWALDIDPAAVDALRFDELVTSARRFRADRAADTLNDALALWQGRPYLDVEAHGRLDAEIARLEELHLYALEARIDADLASGRAEELLPELTALVTGYPYREGLRAQHMIALYRSGRQQEALASFEELRALLLEELGVDPTPELRELEQRILQQDRALLVDPEPEGEPLRGYRLLDEIGSGAFSVVWRGIQPSVDREVAIKQIRSELASRPEFIRRFEAEAQLVARIEHPHIVPLIDYWRDPDSAYLVMRWLRGGTIERSLDDGPWSVDRTLRMARQIGDALAEAHARGVIHRDVKSANLLLDERGNAFLGDFGIALEAIASAGPEAALSHGSPSYASPEQLRKEPLAPQADIFSLGVVIYECLAGNLPFPNVSSAVEMVRRQIDETYPPLSSTCPGVPAHIADAVARATAKSPTDRFESVLEFVAALEGGEPTSSAGDGSPTRRTAVTGELANPYKGLRAFDESDAREFFGRERLVDEFVAQLDGNGIPARCLTVVGPSGSGKSSAVRAGLLPAIRAGRVSGAEEWFTTTMIPGPHPFESLEAALLRIAVNPPTTLLHQLTDGPRGILRGVRRCLADDNGRVLLVVDQLEELFTSAPADRAEAFLTALAAAVQDPTTPLRIVTTLRADYYDRPLAHPAFAPVLKAGAVDVTPLAPDELEAAITGPAERHHLQLEGGLVARLAAEALGQPAPLPLLQYTLAELFDRRDGNLLTIEAFDELGGLAGSLAARAEELYAECSHGERAAARRIFGRLVNPEQATVDLRRRALVADLRTNHDAESVLDRFGAARLLTFDREVTTREPTVEVAHEALLREWPRLRTWLDEDRELLRTIDRLSIAADTWHEAGRDATDLYRGGRLEATNALLEDAPDRLRAVDRDFVMASRAAADAEDRVEQRRVQRLRRLVSVVGAALVLALIAGGIAFQQQRRADDEAEQAAANAVQARENEAAANVARGIAEARALTASASDVLDEDAELALLLALEGATGAPDDPTAQRVLRRALQLPATLYSGSLDPDSFFREGAMSGDGGVLVGGGVTYVEARDVDTGETLWRYPYGLGEALGTAYMTFVNDDTEVAVAVRWEPTGPSSPDFPEAAGLHILDAETGTLKRRIPAGPCGGSILEDTIGENRIHYRELTPAFIERVGGCGLDPSSGTVVAQDYLVDVNTGEFVPVGENVIDGPGGPGGRVAFAADGRRWAVYDQGASVLTVTDAESGELLFNIDNTPPSAVLELSGNGELVLLGGGSNGDERRLLVFDVETGELVTSLAGHTSWTDAAHFIDDGRTIVTTGPDGKINRWDTRSGTLLDSITSGTGENRFLWVSDDERRVGVRGSTIGVISLDPADSSERGVIRACDGDGNFYVAQGLTARNDRLLAYAGCGTVDWLEPHVLDLTTGTLVGTGTPAGSQGSDLSPDGRLVAAQRYVPLAGADSPRSLGPVVVTDVDSGEHIVLPGLCEQGDPAGCRTPPDLPFVGSVSDIDFSPDGRLLAAASNPNPGLVWDLESQEVIGQWEFKRVAFAAEGRRIVTFGEFLGGQDVFKLRIRDTTTFEIVDELTITGGFPGYMTITPDESQIVVSYGPDVVIYDLEPLEVRDQWSSAHDGLIQSLTVSNDGTMVATVGSDGVARVWDLATGSLLHDIQVSEDDRAQAAVFRNDDTELLVSTSAGPIRIYTLDVEELLDIARGRIPRGFTDAECNRYFPETDCPTINDLRGA